MPYAILSGALPPDRTGVHVDIFNFFIVIPEILASLALEPVVNDLFLVTEETPVEEGLPARSEATT